MTLALLVKFMPPYAVVLLGILVIVVALSLRFDHLLSLAVLCLVLTEFHYQREPQISYYIRQVSRLARWFVFLAMAIRGLTLALKTPGHRSKRHVIRGLAILVLALAFASILWSMDFHVTLASALLLTLVFVCAFWVMWRVVDSGEEVVRFAHALYRAYWPLIVISMVMFPFLDVDLRDRRYAGLFLNANGLGVLAAVFFPIALWELFRAENGLVKTLRLAVVVCSVAAVYLSGSRSAAVGLLVSGSIFLMHRYRAGFPVFAVVVGVFIAFYMIAGGDLDPVSQEQRQLAILRGADPFENREDLWNDAVDLWTLNPRTILGGYGYGTSRIITEGPVGGSIWERAAGVRGTDYHSSHLQTLLELGLTGEVILLMMLLVILVTGLSFFRGERREALPMVGVALFAALVVMIGDTFAHGWLFSPGSGLSFVFWCFTSLVVRTAQFVKAEKKAPETPVVPATVTAT